MSETDKEDREKDRQTDREKKDLTRPEWRACQHGNVLLNPTGLQTRTKEQKIARKAEKQKSSRSRKINKQECADLLT